MLIYNRLRDPYHTLLRFLKIINRFNNKDEISFDRLRIYDFLLANPQEISKMRLMKSGKSSFKKYENPYNLYDRNILFYNLERIQKIAIEHLVKNNILEKMPHDDIYIMHQDIIPSALIDLLNNTESISNEALEFIIKNLNTIDLYREDGLKDRTNLIGFKYDPKN